MSSQLYVDGTTLITADWLNGADTAVYNYLTAVGGQNTITATGPSTLTAYAAGQAFRFTPVSTNTVSTTLNISTLGPKNVLNDNAACTGGEIKASVPVEVMYDGVAFQIMGKRSFSSSQTMQTRQTFTSGTTTYALPSGAVRIQVRMVAGGGGGSGANTPTGGSSGGNSTFGTLQVNGGGVSSSWTGGTGGAVSTSTIANGTFTAWVGADGGSAGTNGSVAVNLGGGMGGSSPFGGAGASGGNSTAGGSAKANTGSGGGGGGGASSINGAGGGGAGAYIEGFINSPTSTYSLTVGAAGGAGSGLSSTGGAGAAGIIIVDEFYS